MGRVASEPAKKRLRKGHLFSGLLVAFFCIVWIWVYTAGACNLAAAQPYLETATGDNFTPDWQTVYRNNPSTFSLIFAFRTTTNFAAVVGLIVTAIWFFYGGFRFMYISRTEQLRLLSGEFVMTVAAVLRARGKEIDADDMKAMRDEGDAFVQRWLQRSSEYMSDQDEHREPERQSF